MGNTDLISRVETSNGYITCLMVASHCFMLGNVGNVVLVLLVVQFGQSWVI